MCGRCNVLSVTVKITIFHARLFNIGTLFEQKIAQVVNRTEQPKDSITDSVGSREPSGADAAMTELGLIPFTKY